MKCSGGGSIFLAASASPFVVFRRSRVAVLSMSMTARTPEKARKRRKRKECFLWTGRRRKRAVRPAMTVRPMEKPLSCVMICLASPDARHIGGELGIPVEEGG